MEVDDVYDMHVCLVCQSTVVGLVNYINHKKFDCPGRRLSQQVTGVDNTATTSTSEVVVQSGTTPVSNPLNNETSVVSSVVSNGPVSMPEVDNTVTIQTLPTATQAVNHNQQESLPTVSNPVEDKSPDYMQMGGLHLLASQCQPNTEDNLTPVSSSGGIQANQPTVSISTHDLSVVIDFSTMKNDGFSPNVNQTVDPNMVINAKTNSDKPEDFFSSLALQSKSANKDAFSGSSQSDQMFDVVQNNMTELPITNILNSLNFSDDDLDFDEDFLEEAFSDDSDDSYPPPEHTRGKWKPGEGPKRSSSGKWRSQRSLISTGGKWKPGMLSGSGPRTRCSTGSISRSKYSIVNKKEPQEIFCEPCSKNFKDQQSYSSHLESKSHKAKSVKPLKITYDKEDGKYVSELLNSESLQSEESQEEDTASSKSSDVTFKSLDQSSTENEALTNGCKEDEEKQELMDESKEELEEKPVNNNKTEPSCSICDQRFASIYVLTRHLLSTKHKNNSKGKKNIIKTLEQYHKFIVRLSPFQCGICQYYFNTENDLVFHLQQTDHINNCKKLPGELICTLCQYSTHSNEEIMQHMMSSAKHRGEALKGRKLCIIREKWFMAECKFCHKKMHSRVHMKRHIRHKHRKELNVKGHIIGDSNIDEVGEFSCTECDNRKFKTYNAYVIHMNRRHGESDAAICELCDKVLAGRNSFSQHMKSKKHKKKELMRYVSKAVDSSVQDMKAEPKAEVKEENREVELKNENDTEFLEVKYNTEKKSDVPGMYHRSHNNHHLKKPRGPYKKRLHKNPTDLKVFKCNHCDFIANKYSDLRPHYMEVHSNHILVCDLCDITFLNEKALKLHYSGKQHQANLAQVEDAAASTEGENAIYHCHICNKRFTDEAWKQFHIDVYHLHPNSEELLVKELGRPDITWEKYKNFLETVKNLERSERMPCLECGKELKKDYMLEHLRLHSGDRPFKCRYCEIGFMSPLSLRRHLLTHLGLTERKCEICGKEYKKVESYREHMRQHTLEKQGVQKLMCDVCGMAFYLPRQLKHHMRRHGEKKFKCSYQNCHWSFYFANELEAHTKSHTKLRPFLCDQCGYAAGTKNRLLRHSRTHTGERNFHCEYCQYKAGTRTHLRRHMRIHIGSKPYKCPYCDYSCNTHENIRKHIMKTKKHEGLFIYPCKFCNYGSNTVNEFRAHSKTQHPEHYDDDKYEGIAAVMGLYIKEEDLEKPTEGMKINPVKERKVRDESSKVHAKREIEMKTDQESVIVVPAYSQEEVVSQYSSNNDYHIPYSGHSDTDITRPWNPTSQLETERAVSTVIIPGGEVVIAYETDQREPEVHQPRIQNELYYNN